MKSKLNARDREGLHLGVIASLKAAFGNDVEVTAHKGRKGTDGIREAQKAVDNMAREADALSEELKRHTHPVKEIEKALEAIIKDL